MPDATDAQAMSAQPAMPAMSIVPPVPVDIAVPPSPQVSPSSVLPMPPVVPPPLPTMTTTVFPTRASSPDVPPAPADYEVPVSTADTQDEAYARATSIDFTPGDYVLSPMPRPSMPSAVRAHINFLQTYIGLLSPLGSVRDHMSRAEVDRLLVNIEELTALSQALNMLTTVDNARVRELSSTLLRRYMGLYRNVKDRKRK